MRRVATIALVHETLSQTLDESVPFDDLVGRSLRLAADVATEGAHVRTTVRGSFGSIPAEDATALALILTELVTNAVEHGFEGRESGTVEVIVDRQDDVIRVEVADDGSGLPEGRAGGRIRARHADRLDARDQRDARHHRLVEPRGRRHVGRHRGPAAGAPGCGVPDLTCGRRRARRLWARRRARIQPHW